MLVVYTSASDLHGIRGNAGPIRPAASIILPYSGNENSMVDSDSAVVANSTSTLDLGES